MGEVNRVFLVIVGPVRSSLWSVVQIVGAFVVHVIRVTPVALRSSSVKTGINLAIACTELKVLTGLALLGRLPIKGTRCPGVVRSSLVRIRNLGVMISRGVTSILGRIVRIVRAVSAVRDLGQVGRGSLIE